MVVPPLQDGGGSALPSGSVFRRRSPEKLRRYDEKGIDFALLQWFAAAATEARLAVCFGGLAILTGPSLFCLDCLMQFQ